MRFLLVGDHVDGLAAARAIVDSQRHRFTLYNGPPTALTYFQRWGIQPEVVGDFESALADVRVDAVLVAGSSGDRPAQLRRAMQSEHHVLCVHPADQGPDTAYEVGMIQGDTGKQLMPLLVEAYHPGIQELVAWFRQTRKQAKQEGRRWSCRVEVERHEVENALLETQAVGRKPNFPDWHILRSLAGDIAEVFAYAEGDEVDPDRPIFVSGRFLRGGLFRSILLPHQSERRLSIEVVVGQESMRFHFPGGFPGPAELIRLDRFGQEQRDSWDTWNPWPVMIDLFERAVAGRGRPRGLLSGEASTAIREGTPVGSSSDPISISDVTVQPPTWEDAIRSLELDDAARRSIERRRASTLDFQEASEDVTFKGTMTLVGCGLLWGSVVLLILSVWLPWLGWLIVPLFGIFLVLQLLRWVGGSKESVPSVDPPKVDPENVPPTDESSSIQRK